MKCLLGFFSKCCFSNFASFAYTITQKLLNEFHWKLPWWFIIWFKSFVGELFNFFLSQKILSILQIWKMTKFGPNFVIFSKFYIKPSEIKNCKNPLLRSFIKLCFSDLLNKFSKIFTQISCSVFVNWLKNDKKSSAILNMAAILKFFIDVFFQIFKFG